MEFTKCPICREEILVKGERKDALGREWCKDCFEEHESIDHDKQDEESKMNRGDFDKFAVYADKHGFWVAIRDFKIERSEWDKLLKMMRAR
jgi:hypothetical protein